MSIAELKKTADSLSAKDRRWMRAYLFADEQAKSKSWQTSMSVKRRGLRAGKGVSETRYQRRMDSLSRGA